MYFMEAIEVYIMLLNYDPNLCFCVSLTGANQAC
jgi:hypothetical protein